MSYTLPMPRESDLSDPLPTELIALRERIRDQPKDVRTELEPLLDEVLEHTVFRNRVMLIAKEALERFRLDLASLQFELEVTKRERQRLARAGPRKSWGCTDSGPSGFHG